MRELHLDLLSVVHAMRVREIGLGLNPITAVREPMRMREVGLVTAVEGGR